MAITTRRINNALKKYGIQAGQTITLKQFQDVAKYLGLVDKVALSAKDSAIDNGPAAVRLVNAYTQINNVILSSGMESKFYIRAEDYYSTFTLDTDVAKKKAALTRKSAAITRLVSKI